MTLLSFATHFAAVCFGCIITGLAGWRIIAIQDAALNNADEEIDALKTKLAAEKAENEHLASDVRFLRDRLAKAIERGPKGHFLKVAA